MDFFEAQARAKKRTSWLVVLFCLAVVMTVLAGYAATFFLMRQIPREGPYVDPNLAAFYPESLWQPQTLVVVTLGTLLIVSLSSLYKWISFRHGGSTVAESVGGRLIDPVKGTRMEKRLVNIVEEMSIASGMPMPAIYVLDNEPSINAFAAGLTTSDAVVAVTKGTLEKLTRDELQAVIGHEFSHILNGDMRLNVRLSALVFGILFISLIGRGFLYSLYGTRIRSSRDRNSGGIVIAIAAVGIALIIIGYIGYFFGKLIQAAVSRQREFLADAAAVQFTRNPDGITGALSKIGGYALGSKMQTNNAAAIGHFFFAQGFRSMFGGIWATHPPLDQRIRAINPRWEGEFFAPDELVDIEKESFQSKGFSSPQASAKARADVGLPPPLIDPSRRIPFEPATIIGDVGLLTDGYYKQAKELLAEIPEPLREAARDPAQVAALIYSLLTSVEDEDTPAQSDIVKRTAPASFEAFENLLFHTQSLDPATRLPLLLLTTPALRQLTHTPLNEFLGTLDELVHADAKVNTFEFVLQKLLTRHLNLAQTPTQRVDYHSFTTVSDEISVVLSVLARAGSEDPQAIGTAFATGADQLRLLENKLSYLDPEQSNLEALDNALEKLAVSSLPIRKRLLIAAAHTVGSDQTITVTEGELYRAVAVTLDCPLPPLGAIPTEKQG